MEGGRTEQQQQPGPPPRWLEFAAWLRQQAGSPPEEAASEASASDAEEAELSLTPEPQASSRSRASIAGAPSPGGPHRGGHSPAASPGASPVTPGQLARHATTLVPRLPDCRAETRLTSDSCSRARQEMTVMLAAPGMPLHQAPVLTARQASALMTAICEPLLSVPVGRLTRKLSAPTKLQPTEDRGVLSLWLLPDDSLSLVWQSMQQLAHEAVEDAMSSDAGPATACDGEAEAGSSSPGGSAPAPALQQSCSVAVWEELAHFPAQAHLLEEAPVVTIHMLRGDASGRSFYIRVRADVAEANLEAATAAVPDASRMLQQRAAASSGSGDASAAAAAGEPPGAPRMYFWLADGDLGKAVYSLGRLKSLLKRPPTLSKRSGVPERQLVQLGAWLQRADLAAAEQQRAAAARQQQQLGPHAWDAEAQVDSSEGASSSQTELPAATGSRPRAGPPHLSPLLSGSACAPGLLLGQPGTMAAAAQVQGSMAAAGRSASEGGHPGSGPSPAVACSTVSATAAALYQDHRFNVVCPCTISVVVGMRVQAEGAEPTALSAEASSRARAVAERHAKSAVDRSGRQRIEERLAEVVIRNIREQRNRVRQARQAQRDSMARLLAAERALELARRATGRTVAPATALAAAAPAEAQLEAAAAEALLPLEAAQPAGAGAAGPQAEAHGTAFSLAGSSNSGEYELTQPSSPAHRAITDGGCQGMRAFSAPLPGGRVTINNLQSLLAQPHEHSSASTARQSSAPANLAPVPAAPAAPAPDGGAGARSTRVSVSDLADLLGTHAKVE